MPKVSELEGVGLDWLVAKVAGMNARIGDDGTLQKRPTALVTRGGRMGTMPYEGPFRPSFYWSDGGPIIERERISVYASLDEGNLLYWVAVVETAQTTRRGWIGPTPLIAAMRAFVASKYGDVVPEEGQTS